VRRGRLPSRAGTCCQSVSAGSDEHGAAVGIEIVVSLDLEQAALNRRGAAQPP
jgi:hypothetical protein